MQIHDISNKEMFYFLSNIRTLGTAGIRRIHERCPNLYEILTMSFQEMRERFLIADTKLDAIQVAIGFFEEYMTEYANLNKKGISFYTLEDEAFPRQLREIPNAPMFCFQKGRIQYPQQKRIAIVGSRNPSNYGKEMARYIASNLAKKGVGIVSGMASGIDSVAHRAAMKEAVDNIAVLGCGVDVCYPQDNFYLYEDMTKQACVMSEYPPKTKPLSFHFPMRNRIISGLADLVLVVEAREKSGSLITVDHALEQGKTVYAVPGRVTDALSKGCNALIEMGAGVFLTVDDLLEQLLGTYKPDFSRGISEKNINGLANNEKMVYSCVDLEPKCMDQIVDEVGLSYGEVYTALLELELQGLISQISRNYYARQL